MDDVTLKFYVNGLDTTTSVELDIDVPRDVWNEMREDERDKIARACYNENVTWCYEEA